jgi:hypothetical protein
MASFGIADEDASLHPTILELTGKEVDDQILRLGEFETGAAGLVKRTEDAAAAPGSRASPLTLCALPTAAGGISVCGNGPRVATASP